MIEEEKKLYDLIIRIYEKFIMGKKTKKYKVTCVISFKKVRNERVGIMKINSMSVMQKAKRRGGIHQLAQLSFLQRNRQSIISIYIES